MKPTLAYSAPLLPIAVTLILGVAMGFCVTMTVTRLVLALALVMVAGCLSGRWPRWQECCVFMGVGLLGMVLAGLQRQQAGRWTYGDGEQTLELVVLSEPVEKARSVAVDVLQTCNGRKLKCYLAKDGRSRMLKPGDGLVARSRIEPVSQWRKGRFDYGRYLEQNGFAGSCYVKAAAWQPARVSMAALSRVDRLRITFLRWRHSLLERYRLQGAEAEGYAVLAAMTLGDRTALERDLREVYAVAGASHVLALSGLHVGVLYFFLTWLLPVRRFRLWSQTLLVMAVWAFALLAGLPVSLVRSAVMFSVFTIFSIGGRQGASLNTLSLAAILILLFHPLAVYDVGFQLSFMSVFGILLVMPAMREWLPWGDEWWKSWLLRPLASLLMVSVAAQMGVAPLVAYYFGRFPVWFLLTNLVAVPAVYLILLGGMLMLLLPFLPLAPIVVGIISVLNRLLTAIAHLPLASIEGLHPSVAQVVLCYVVMALLLVAATVACRRHVPDSRW